ncbi:GNAT family N-acetyltransferase [Rubrivirga sp. IMCC45206]|uniref:GNAT family N-acetyltransferase n=1 Tax=Rubrivirga sp. IMCC45206 TaxID=3391614 RepID=UPI00398FB71E
MLFETARLVVRRLTLADAPFIRGLVTEPGWLRWIGSRDVESTADAERYLREGPLASYAAHGHGLYLVALKTGEPVGICGVLRRPTLDAPDLGYAIAARHAGHGYATEAARATLAHARRDLRMARVVAISDTDHAASHRVLEKAGMRRAGTVAGDDGVRLALFETGWGDPAPTGPA